MNRLVSIVVVYFSDSRFKNVQNTLETEFKTRLDIGEHSSVGEVCACVIDVQAPDSFVLADMQRRLEAALPSVRIKMMERFRESWWRRYRWNIAIAIGGGIAVAFIVDLVRSSAERLRDLLG